MNYCATCKNTVTTMSDSQMVMKSPPHDLVYQKPLPSTCTDFRSTAGKKLFAESLTEGNMNIFFELSAQFVTQDEPTYCAVSTMVMTLNALRVDPGKRWKGIWKWYDERLLIHCKPLEKVKESGLNFKEFACLCRCNGLKVDEVYVESNAQESLEQLRASVLRSVRSTDEILIANYHRQTLSQTGTGHFSPIAGYHSKSDKVLILDVARFKYPPYWVDLELLWGAMQQKDQDASTLVWKYCLHMYQCVYSIIHNLDLSRGYFLVTTANNRKRFGTRKNSQVGKGRLGKFPSFFASIPIPQWIQQHTNRLTALFLNDVED